MSEFEISLLRQRAIEAADRKWPRPGADPGSRRLCPDRRRRHGEDSGSSDSRSHRGIFRKFRELGSVRQVLLWYRDEKLLIPALSRESGHRKVIWIEPVYPRIFGILKNPTYAGVFVWGRNHTRSSIVDGRARKTRGHARPQEQWEVTIPNHHEGYITWEEFMRNQQQIRANAGWNARMGSANGAVRNGPALLAGLIALRSLRTALQVTYTRSKQHGLLPRYWCAGDRGRQMVRSCITFAGTRVDQVVAIEVLEALRPLGVQAALEPGTESEPDR